MRSRSDGGGNDGHLPWPIELIEQYEARWPVGTKERLMFDVYLACGGAMRLGWANSTCAAASSLEWIFSPAPHTRFDWMKLRKQASLKTLQLASAK